MDIYGSQTIATGLGRAPAGELDIEFRARVSFFDAHPHPNGFLIDPHVEVRDNGGNPLSYAAGAFPNMVTNFHKGRNFEVVFVPDGTPGGDGAVVDGYDYDRVSRGAQIKYFPPFRFPGQYYDEETDLHENWNRYYGLDGRYLSPEPLLQSPAYVRRMAQTGMSVPTYAYAANNPLRYADPDGLRIVWNQNDAALNRQVTRLRSTATGKALFDLLDARPEVIGLGDLGGIRWRADGSWLAGGTNPTSNGGSECRAITHRSLERVRWTDKHGRRWPMDPAAILGHELVHAMDNIFDPRGWGDETYPLEIQERIQQELESSP